MQIGGGYKVRSDLLVLEEDYLRMEESIGFRVDGILGANLFRHFVLAVNNRKGRIKLIEVEHFKPPQRYEQINISVSKNKPYIDGRTQIREDTLTVKLLIDTGAGLPLLLYTRSADELTLPPKTIRGTLGIGLGGQLEGYVGRVNHFSFGTFEFNDIVASFQDVELDSLEFADLQRHGIMGNVVMSRFQYIIDYPHEMLYMLGRSRLTRKFRFDRSGLQIAATGKNLKDFVIQRVIADSPADQAGLLAGDVIVKLLGIPASFYSLPSVTNLLSRRTGKRISVTIDREGDKLRHAFKLREIV